MTLGSQQPRSSSATLFGTNRRKLIPIALALVAAAGVAGGTFYFTGNDKTPTADRVSTNAVPPTTVTPSVAPIVAQKTTEMPAITANSGRQPVAMTAPVEGGGAAIQPVTPSASVTTAATKAPTTTNLATTLAMAPADPLGARLALTHLLDRRELNAAEEFSAITSLRELNAKLFFSPAMSVGDPFIRVYTVQPGDTLSKVAKKNDVQTDWRIIQRMNGMKSEKSLRIGQKLKLPVGAFHAEVSKSNYQMKIYAGEGPSRVLIAIFPVGLGELNSTPTGAFMVRPKSKLINPEWKNPRTGEHFASDDPKNPIGERWIGLIGVEAHNQGFKGYGIHGTVDPASIGKQASMGCVRMSDADVELVYEFLTEPNSTIVIAP